MKISRTSRKIKKGGYIEYKGKKLYLDGNTLVEDIGKLLIRGVDGTWYWEEDSKEARFA